MRALVKEEAGGFVVRSPLNPAAGAKPADHLRHCRSWRRFGLAEASRGSRRVRSRAATGEASAGRLRFVEWRPADWVGGMDQLFQLWNARHWVAGHRPAAPSRLASQLECARVRVKMAFEEKTIPFE